MSRADSEHDPSTARAGPEHMLDGCLRSHSHSHTQDVGGLVGEGVPMASEEGGERPAPLPGALAEVLADFGICLMDDVRRLRLADALMGDGCGQGTLEALCAYVERQAGHDPAMTGKRLVALLQPGKWQRAARAAQRHAEREAAPEKPRPGEHDHGATRRAEDDACQVEARQTDHYTAGWVYARVAYERKNPREVAQEMGVSIEKLPALVRAGAEQYGADPDEAAELLRKAVGR